MTIDVAIVGAGVAGLVAARELAKLGHSVEVFEAAAEPGGMVRPLRIAELMLDRGAESFATRGGAVAELVDELGLERVDPNPQGSWLIFGDGAAPTPQGTLFGIPGDVTADDVLRVIGEEGAHEARRDLQLAAEIGTESGMLGDLVRERMGERVLRRLVEPVVAGVYSSMPDDVPVRQIAPPLLEAIREHGSLQAAVSGLRGPTAARPGAGVQGIVGGMHKLVQELATDLQRHGGILRLAAPATSIAHAGNWQIRSLHGMTEARALVIATDGVRAAELLRQLQPARPPIGVQAAKVELVTLVLPEGSIDGTPRGSGALVTADAHDVTAKALTHATAKWQWLREAAEGREVVRLSYGRTGRTPDTAELSENETFSLARRDAERILGQSLPAPLEAARVRLAQNRSRVQPDVSALPNTAVVGAWSAGTGLASVVPHSIETAQRLSRVLQ